MIQAEVAEQSYSILLHFLLETLPSSISELRTNRVLSFFTINPISLGIFLQIAIILLLIIAFRSLKKTKFRIFAEWLIESIYKFFEEILEESGKRRVKSYVVTLFFVILISNLSAWILDWIRVIFTDIERLSSIIVIPTTTFEFNIAVASISVLLVLFSQLNYLGTWKTIYEYIPFWGKGIVDIERGKLPWIAYYPAKFFVKLADIGLSLFIGLLDIVGMLAKVISLAARLYGNMIAGGILLTILVMGFGEMTSNLLGHQFPVIVPLILYAQGLLVALIQAFVFPLLVGIFIKLSQTET